jgi:nicotinate phosphoribosyltransferase
MNRQIITSMLDLDLYKITMMQIAFHRYPGAFVETEFRCRTGGANLARLYFQVNEQIKSLEDLRFTPSELMYLNQRLSFIKKDFVDFLSIFKFDVSQVHVSTDGEELVIKTYGSWWQTILYEIFVLAIVNELHYADLMKDMTKREVSNLYEEGRARLQTKLDLVKNKDGFVFTDFGTRRRFNKEWHYEVVDFCKHEVPNRLFGTSNVYLAKELDINPVGTMAHEYLQAFQAFDNRLVDSQKAALEAWVQEYRGDLGIALTDVIGIDSFLKDFDLYFAKLFDGVRHDSGDPVIWGNKVIDHYQKLKIDPKTKLLVFSDGLTFPRSVELFDYFSPNIKTSFGIGTNLTNDLGFKAINIVMKMTSCNGKPVAKISDSPGKGMCKDKEHEKYLIKVFNEKPTLFENTLGYRVA